MNKAIVFEDWYGFKAHCFELNTFFVVKLTQIEISNLELVNL